MAKRAFIIAIENYTQMQEGLNSTLPRTHEHALEFRKWLIEKQQLAPGDIFFCTDDPGLEGRTADATRVAIKQELKRFKEAARDTTSDMFFYFSGHGFCYVDIDDLPSADVLLASDYVKRDESGDACLKLDEIQRWLKFGLGSVTDPGSTHCGHFYFVDACRNKISAKDIKVADLGLAHEPSVRKKAPVYTLWSTTTGAVANVGGGFPEALLDGLHGKGKAKRFFEGSFTVLFDSLRGYIEDRLGTELEPRAEGGDGVILKLGPSLKYTCALVVKNADAQDEFQVQVKNDLNQVVETFEFRGAKRSFQQPPDDYFIVVQPTKPAAATIEPSAPVPADLYEDCALEFEKRPPTRADASASEIRRGGTRGQPVRDVPVPTASVTFTIPDATEVILHGAKGKVEHVKASGTVGLSPGSYRMELRDAARGVVIDRRRVTIDPGPQVMDLAGAPATPLRRALLSAIPHQNGVIDFSESLGPTPDQGMDLWLALIGAARIIGPGDFSKLGKLPLATFDDPATGDSVVYVLGAFEQPTVRLSAVVSQDWHAPRAPIAGHASIPGLYEIVAPPGPPGFRYLTVRVDDNAPITFGVCSLHGRGTLVTLAQSPEGALQIQQFILPLRRFINVLPEGSGLWLGGSDPEMKDVDGPLRLVRRRVEVQRAFARGEDLRALMTKMELQSLLYFKWFEPIVALLAGYELARRGDVDDLRIAVQNLRGHFKGLPDNEALAHLAGMNPVVPAVPPIVLDGFQALNLMAGQPGLPPAEAVVFRGPWTMWRV
jgi:caspase domain-containing protein